MFTSIFWESLTNGMSTIALLTLLMGLCNHRYTATQFALFTAISAIPRVFISSLSGFMVVQLGWAAYFIGTSLVAIPSLILLCGLRKSVNATSVNGSEAVA